MNKDVVVIRAYFKAENGQGINLSPFYFIGGNMFEADFVKAIQYPNKQEAEKAMVGISSHLRFYAEIVTIYPNY